MAIQGDVERPCAPGSPRFARDDSIAAVSLPARDGRPQNPVQSLEKVDSAPGNALAPETGADVRATADRHREPRRGVAIEGNVERPCAPGSPRFARDDAIAAVSLPARDGRPQNPVQSLEKVDSAPGNEAAREDRADARATADCHRQPRSGVAIQGNVERPCAPGSPRSARDDAIAAVSLPARGIAHKIRRKALKRLIPRPEMKRPRRLGRMPDPRPMFAGLQRRLLPTSSLSRVKAHRRFGRRRPQLGCWI